MDPDDRTRLRALVDIATPGPWQVGDGSETARAWVVHVSETGWDDRTTVTSAEPGENEDQERKDAEFIAVTRAALPALLDDIDKLEGHLQRVLDVLDQANLRPGTEEHELARRIRRALDEDDRGEPAR